LRLRICLVLLVLLLLLHLLLLWCVEPSVMEMA
jgi:hypothetical protein